MDQEKKNLLEMIDRPVFIVRDGIITVCNESAKHRMIAEGQPIKPFLTGEDHAYKNFQGGILYLTLNINWVTCGATVVRREEGDVFLLDRDADRAQLQILTLAAQQLRTPLSNVMTVADCLLDELQDEGQLERTNQMRKGLFQLMRIIGNMADAERYTGLNEPVMERTELCGFFREIFERANASLAPHGATIHFSYPDKPIFTMTDRERLERSVYNLISNAVKFSESGSKVTVTLTRNGRIARLTVENQGDTIPTHVLGDLFHRYMREPAIEDSRFGLGLGMTLIRTTASLHGGTVLLEQNGGTRVTMTLEIRNAVPGALRSPILRISNYAGGQDLGLLEFSETLPPNAYQKDI